MELLAKLGIYLMGYAILSSIGHQKDKFFLVHIIIYVIGGLLFVLY